MCKRGEANRDPVLPRLSVDARYGAETRELDFSVRTTVEAEQADTIARLVQVDGHERPTGDQRRRQLVGLLGDDFLDLRRRLRIDRDDAPQGRGAIVAKVQPSGGGAGERAGIGETREDRAGTGCLESAIDGRFALSLDPSKAVITTQRSPCATSTSKTTSLRSGMSNTRRSMACGSPTRWKQTAQK